MDLAKLTETLGVKVDAELLTQALTHRSFAYENGGIPNSERLEFLGDSVLGFVVTEHIYHSLPDYTEGELTNVKSRLVSEKTLALVAKELGLGEQLRLGRSEDNKVGRNRPSLLCDAFEAVLAAVFLSAGFEAARKLIETHIFPLLSDPEALRYQVDPKTWIVELSDARELGKVTYEVVSSGPPHDPVFEATILLGGVKFGSATAKTKKTAEAAAAQAALQVLRETHE